jgi:hypothetical protein
LLVVFLRRVTVFACTPPVLCLRALFGWGALLRLRCAGVWPLDVAGTLPRAFAFALAPFAVVLFEDGFGSVIAESATPDFLLRRSVRLSRFGSWLFGVG